MKNILRLIIIAILCSSHAHSQNISSEINISPGIEFILKDPFKGYTNQNSSQPSFSFQLQYQLLFDRAGFNVSLEMMSRNIDMQGSQLPNEFHTLNGNTRVDRLMFYFVARAGKAKSKFSMDFRFGLGKLLSSEEYFFKNPPLNVIHAFIPGLSFGTGIKSNFQVSPRLSAFLDVKLSFLPYSYTSYTDYFWSQGWRTHSSYLADLGIFTGLSININRK